jgi:hypothetical protein
LLPTPFDKTTMKTLLLLLALTPTAAAEPVRLYAVSITWHAGPTLTIQPEITDRLPVFVGQFKTRHLAEKLAAYPKDSLAWNIRTQVNQVAAKLAEFPDLMTEIENEAGFTGRLDRGVAIEYHSQVLTLEVPVKIGKERRTVRVKIEKLADGELIAN